MSAIKTLKTFSKVIITVLFSIILVLSILSPALADEPFTQSADIAESNTSTYKDVDKEAWYANYVAQVVQNGIMIGYGDSDLFGPEDELTRAQAVVILYRVYCTYGVEYEGDRGKDEGIDFPDTDQTGFIDVAQSDWYTKELNWAVHYGIVTGYCDEDGGYSTFSPENSVTREELAAMTARWFQFYEYDSLHSTFSSVSVEDLGNHFSDANKFSLWAVQSFQYWAPLRDIDITLFFHGVQKEIDLPEFQSLRVATRAEAASVASGIIVFCTPVVPC